MATKYGLTHDIAEKNINVVWFLIDALRADHVGCYGYKKNTTPFIDGFAKKSVLFEKAFAPESYTQASVASFFTATYPATHQCRYDHPRIDTLSPKFLTLAEILGFAGYATAAFVFNPHLNSKYGLNQGFQLYRDNKEGFPKRGKRYERYETARKIHERTEQYLKENRTGPHFLYLHYRDVHSPYLPPPPYHGMFLPKGVKPDLDVLRDEEGKQLSVKDNVELFISQYDGEIYYTDRYIKKTIGMLSRYGIDRDNTIFIISSDHGEEFYDPHPRDKGNREHGRTLYWEQIHVPLIFSFPGLKPQKKRLSSNVSLVDVMPTVFDYLGVDVQKFKQFQGESLLGMIKSGVEKERTIYCGGTHRRGTIIDGQWKYNTIDASRKRRRTSNFKQPEENQKYRFVSDMFNLSKDPWERKDVIKDHPEIAAKLAEDLKRIERKYGLQHRSSPKKKTGHTQKLDKETIEQLKQLGYID